MNRLLAYVVRLIVWCAGLVKPLSRLGLMRYEEWQPGQRLRILLVGYNGARNTGADARVVALTQQLQQLLGTDRAELTVMTLDEDNVKGYFAPAVRLYRFTTFFFFSLLRATSRSHIAVLCEGSTLTRTFADALTIFYCEAAGIMQRQGKPCIAYGSEVGIVEGWLGRLCTDLCRSTYFIVRTEASLHNLQALGLHGHVGTDTAWTFQTPEGEAWAKEVLHNAGWDGNQPLIGTAVIDPFCWPVRPSLWRWIKAVITGDRTLQYDKMFFFSESEERHHRFHTYLSEVAKAVNRYQHEHNGFVVILGMEKLDTKACQMFEQMIEGPHAVFTSLRCNVFQMTGLLRQLSLLVTSRYHAAVLSMEHANPIVAVSMDNRLDGVMSETNLAKDYLHHVDDADLGEHITASLHLADRHRDDITNHIRHHLQEYKMQVEKMSIFFAKWLKEQFS